MKPNIGNFERAVRVILAIFSFFAAVYLFSNPAARLLAGLFGIFCLYEAASSTCGLYRHLGFVSAQTRLPKEALFLLGAIGVQVSLAYEWWYAGWEKVSGGKFVPAISGILSSFAGKNPFPWYKDFLTGVALPNADAFAYAVEFGELAVGAALFASACVYLYSKNKAAQRFILMLSVLALLGGAFMNANFYLAAAWTGAATRSGNVLMFWPEMVLVYLWLSVLI